MENNKQKKARGEGMSVRNSLWRGVSGTRYIFWAYKLPATLSAGQNGNYIFARMFHGKWIPIFIGQGDVGRELDDHPRSDCIRSKGATHFHAHKNPDERSRLAELSDLLAAYPQAYEPNGCNARTGG